MATEAQKYIASMFEVHTEVGQLRDNLQEQHRIWLDFYSTVFHVRVLTHCLCDGLMQHAPWLYLGWGLLQRCHNTTPATLAPSVACSLYCDLRVPGQHPTCCT